jgi:hypothetical protein
MAYPDLPGGMARPCTLRSVALRLEASLGASKPRPNPPSTWRLSRFQPGPDQTPALLNQTRALSNQFQSNPGTLQSNTGTL